MSLNKNKLGLTVGIFAAAAHLIWALTVALGFGQGFLNWIFPLHFLDNVYSVMPFSLKTAVMIVVMAFVCGYVCAWLFGALWNYVEKKV